MEIAAKNFESLSYRELQKAAKARGLNAGGKKEQIRHRLQSAAAAQEKENAASDKPKNSAASAPKQQPRGKENDPPAMPRKTKTLASSEASPRLPKKALGQISLNSPRANQRMAVSTQSKKPFVNTAVPSATETQVSLPGPGAASEATSTAAMTAPVASKVAQAGEATDAAAPADVARGRPSMMVVTANPRLQEVSALPRGKVVRVKLFAENGEEDEERQEGLSPTAAAAAAEPVGSEEDEEQQNQGAHDGEVEEHRPEVVVVEKNHDGTEAAVCVQDIAPSAGPTNGGGEQVESPGPSLLTEEGQDTGEQQQQQQKQQKQQNDDMAAFASEEAGPDAAQKKVPEGAGATTTVALQLSAPEEEHVGAIEETAAAAGGDTALPATSVVVEESQEDGRLGHAAPVLPPSSGQGDREKDKVLVPAQQPNEVAVATGKVTGENKEKLAAVQAEAMSSTPTEGKGDDVSELQHVGLVVDEETRNLVEGSKYLQFVDDERSVLCTLTGKKVAPVYDGIILYLGSRKVQRLMVEGPFFMTDYEGMFMVEDPADEGFVFCELTGERLFKSKAAVDQHINGQPFREMMALIRAKLDV